MKTRRLSRQTAAKAAVRFATTGSGVDLDGPSESDRLKRIYAQCVAEVEQENAAQQHAALAPVRELETKLTADRIEKMRRARIDLMNPDYPYFAEICPAYAKYAGTEDCYIDDVRAAFLSLSDSLASEGVTVTQAGLDLLGELADDNRFIDWSSPATFSAVWEHLVETGFVRQGRDFTVEAQTEEQPAPQPRQVLEPQSCDELRTAAEAEYLAMAQPVWQEFQSYLLENWGVTLTTSQRHEAIETA